MFAVSIVVFWIGLVAVGFTIGVIPLVGSLLQRTAMHLLLFVQAGLVGGFLRRNAEEFGYD